MEMYIYIYINYIRIHTHKHIYIKLQEVTYGPFFTCIGEATEKQSHHPRFIITHLSISTEHCRRVPKLNPSGQNPAGLTDYSCKARCGLTWCPWWLLAWGGQPAACAWAAWQQSGWGTRGCKTHLPGSSWRVWGRARRRRAACRREGRRG